MFSGDTHTHTHTLYVCMEGEGGVPEVTSHGGEIIISLKIIDLSHFCETRPSDQPSNRAPSQPTNQPTNQPPVVGVMWCIYLLSKTECVCVCRRRGCVFVQREAEGKKRHPAPPPHVGLGGWGIGWEFKLQFKLQVELQLKCL